MKEIAGWKETEAGIESDFEFKDFVQAFAFMTKVAEVAEEMQHHPEWSNTYNKVSIKLFSHDQEAVTEKDYQMAEQINQLKGLF